MTHAASPALFTSLEIGASKVCAVIAECCGDEVRLRAHAERDRAGVPVVSPAGAHTPDGPDPLVSEVREVLAAAAAQLGSADASAAGSPLVVTSSAVDLASREFDVAVDVGGRAIGPDDIERLGELASTGPAGRREQVLWCVPSRFIVDGSPVPGHPEGIIAERLAAHVTVLTAPEHQLEGVEVLLERAGVEMTAFCPTPLASSYGVVDPEPPAGDSDETAVRDLVILDYGARNVQVAAFTEGRLVHACALPLGVQRVVERLAAEFRLSGDAALALALAHLKTLRWLGEPERVIELPGGRRIEQGDVSDVVAHVLEELVHAIVSRLRSTALARGAPAIVLTGGGSRLPTLAEFFEEMLGAPADTSAPAWSSPGAALARNVRVGGPARTFEHAPRVLRNADGVKLLERLSGPQHAAIIGLLRLGPEYLEEREDRASLFRVRSRPRALAVA
jgi:cell division protein FtsA